MGRHNRAARWEKAHVTPMAWALAFAMLLPSCGHSESANPAAPTPGGQGTVVLSGAGDIGHCDTLPAGERVARVLDGIEGLIFTAGDNAYSNGTLEEFRKCYGPTWGRHRSRTRPSPGNHDYNTPGATGYFEYFGDLAGPSGIGYYSYEHGAWKILSLNSNVPAGPGSAQFNWVAQELKDSSARCTLAYWHHPVFSSGYDGNMPTMRGIWQLLYDNNAEVVIVGHSHNYERFAPQDLDGQPKPGRGIREFVVGTGGTPFTALESLKANSEVFNNDSHGVLKLTLASTSYTWEFIPAAGASFRDSGSDGCF